MTPREGPKKVNRKNHPDESDRDINGPDQLGIFFTARQPERERDGRCNDDQLPAPEVQIGEKITRQPCFDQALSGVIDAREHHVANEGKNNGIGV